MVKQIVIPPVLRDTILERCHDSPIGGHLSVEKTLYAVLSHYYWKGAMSDVRRYVKTCPVCAENNGRLKKAPNMPIQPAKYPFERLCVDFVGPLTLSRNRNRYLLVFIDAFTRYAEVIPVRDCTAETAALEFVNKIVNRYGTWRASASKYNSIKKLSTTSFRPTCNSIVERVNGTICSILRHYANSKNWEDNLGAAVSAYNNAVHSALGESPHYMLFGYDAVNHDVSDKDVSEFRKPSLAERLKEMQDARETVRKFLSENYDERVKKYKAQTVRTFETGDLVLLAVPKGKGSSKFSAKFYGPFRVVAKVSEVNFRVRGVNMHDEQVVHIDRMKAFRSMRNRKPAAAKRECYPRRWMIPLALEGGRVPVVSLPAERCPHHR
ncbi:K02A2.6-like [Cordylochernes scorpioides]|uniref:RNA-directed DNA polymerase n=1 Tax=Cordylochernes scorpioides TaxID=51811 RepID=A0ABY6KFF7_9ARAC|nr:K02A2.6-like [Cordylochernes scorpioides]